MLLCFIQHLRSSTIARVNGAIMAEAATTSAVKCRRIEWQICVDRPRMEECLPLDALEAIMGFLDLESLCTARLVSKIFCAAASAHVCSLTIPSTSKAVPFHRYPHLQHVTVTHVLAPVRDKEEESFAQLDPGLRDVATALTVSSRYYQASIAQTRDFLSHAALMPKLRELNVKGRVEHDAALLARCTNLEGIKFVRCSIPVARTLITLTRLTSLDICRLPQDNDQDEDDISWLEPLRSLQSLRVSKNRDLSPIGNLTGLTGLTLWDHWGWIPKHSIAPLTRLIRLRSLCLASGLTEDNLAIAGSLGSGSLVDLELWVCEMGGDCGRFLSRQTALTRLSLRARGLCNLRHNGAVRIELLRCLKIDNIDVLDAECLSVLCGATSLTELSIAAFNERPQMGLSQALARLTQVRSLTLTWLNRRGVEPNILDLSLSLSTLTALTKLQLTSHRLDDGDLGALLVLTGLRVLELRSCRLTGDMLPELGVLTSLTSLTVSGDGITSLAPVSKALDPLRYARGLPPLRTSML